jgi:hypothetical protein
MIRGELGDWQQSHPAGVGGATAVLSLAAGVMFNQREY